MHSPRTRRAPRRRIAMLGSAALLCALMATGASPAFAVSQKLKEEYAPFLDCPTATAKYCVYSEVTGGEFKMGNKQVPIEKPIVLQGGLEKENAAPQSLIPARDGDTLISPPQKVPGGLLGIGLLEGITGEVTATATLAGPATNVKVNQFYLIEGGGMAVELPLKIKLDNPLLGDNCSIGSETEPVVLHLATSVKGTVTDLDKNRIVKVNGVTLEDNTFPVPAAKDCGLSTPLVNLLAGLPAPAGSNKAVMIGSFEQSAVEWVLKYDKQPKEKKKK